MNNDSGSKNNAWRREFSNEMRQNIGDKLMDRFTELKSRLNASDQNSLANCYQTSMQYEGKGFHFMTSKFVQQRNASEQKQQPLCLQKPSNLLQQSLLLKDNVFVMPQPVTLGVCDSNVLNFQQQHGTPKKSFLPTEAMQKGFQHFPSLYQYQCLLDQQKLHKSKRALPEASPLIEQSEISRSHLYKRQKQIVLEPPQYQHFQPVAMKNSTGNQSSEQHFNNTTIVQQNQKFVQQRNASEQKQQPLCLQKNSNSPQQPLVLEENVFETPQPVNFSKFNALNFQQQQNYGPAKKCFLPIEVMQEGFQHFCSPHQAKGLADQKKIRNSKRAHQEASTAREASASNETLDVADWHHQAYREESKSELPDTHKREMSQLARMINFLNASPNDIAMISKDVFDCQKLTLIHTDNSIRNLIATQQQAQLQPSQPQISSQQQRGNGNVELQSVNLASRSTLDGPSPWPIEHPETLTQGVQIEKEPMELQNTIGGENPQMLQEQQLTAQQVECPFEYKPLVASRLSSLSCRPQSAETSTLVDAQIELQSLNSQPIDLQCVVASNMNPSVVSQLSSATCPQSAVSSTLVDTEIELQSLIAQPTDHQCAVVTNLNLPVASPLSTATCTQSSVPSTQVDAPRELLSLTAQPIDHQCAAVSNLNSSEASGLSSATCPQSVVSSTLVDGQTEHQSPRVQPIDRLCAVEQSVSPGALLSSVEDIFSVVSSADIISRTTIDNNPKAALREDLAYAQYLHTSAKHDITPHAFDASIPFIDETEQIVASGNKRQKTEAKYYLLDEIKRINHRLIESVVDVESSEVDLNTEVIKAKVLQCSYIPMAIRKAYKSNISSDVFPELKLRVLVPADYPNASPIVLDSLIAESTSDKSKNFMEKAKLKLGISVCLLSKPFSLEDIARVWDLCCRAVFFDFAHTQGA